MMNEVKSDMHNLAGTWVGTILGTNTADVLVEMEQAHATVFGTARINDRVFGVNIYQFTGSINGNTVALQMKPENAQRVSAVSLSIDGRPVKMEVPTVNFGDVTAEGILSNSTIAGKWTSSLGTGGTFSIAKSESVADRPVCTPMNEKDQVFVMMSIAKDLPELEDVLNAIKRSSQQYSLDCIRVDEIEHTGKITDVILDHIDCSKYLVCDISSERPNVYYELGYAHGRGKEVILIAKEGSSIHFDIKDYNTIFYRNITELEERLSRRIEAMQQKK